MEYSSSRSANDLDPTKTVVFQDVPDTDCFYYKLADKLLVLLRLFYIGRVYSSGKLDLVVEFPNSTAEEVFEELERHGIGEKPISYPEYMSSRKEQSQPSITVTNRFEAFRSLEETDEAVIAEAMHVEDDIPIDSEEVAKKQSDTWLSVMRRKPGAKAIARKCRETRCEWGIHCVKAHNCKYLHTEKEKTIFQEHPKVNFRYWKIKLCERSKPHREESCRFAHNDSDSWCLKCKTFGHLTDACKG